jgi:phage shock protein E
LKSIYQFATQFVAEKRELPRDCDPLITLADARKRIREVAPREITKLRQSPVIIDVRENDEFLQGHISGAINVSRGVLERKVRNIVPDPLSLILLYCSCGNRSALAADNLQKMGYQNVYSLKGSLSAWLESGGVVETRRTLGSSRENYVVKNLPPRTRCQSREPRL